MTTRSQASACSRASAWSRVTTTPLPAASPSSLTTYGGPNSTSARSISSASAQTKERPVGTPAAAITSLANAFDPSSRAAAAVGPKTGDAASGHRVGDAGDQWRLWPDDDQSHAEPLREGGDGLTVHRVDLVQGRDSGHPGVAGRRVHLVDSGIRGQMPEPVRVRVRRCR